MLKFNLIENALDSLEHAITHLTEHKKPDTGDFKRAILDLAHVVELLLKERLRMIHPAFVLTNVDKYPSHRAHTVTAEYARMRLEKIGAVHFSDEDIAALKTIREKRNEIEHFEFSIDTNEARIVIGNILFFVFRFSLDELSLDWAERRLDHPRWSKLNEYAEFYTAQLSYIHEQIDGALPPFDCPSCHNDVFDIEAGLCLLCGYREDAEKCRLCEADYLPSSTENAECELCPKCEYEDGYASANYEKS